jgi:hypothetical protein
MLNCRPPPGEPMLRDTEYRIIDDEIAYLVNNPPEGYEFKGGKVQNQPGYRLVKMNPRRRGKDVA